MLVVQAPKDDNWVGHLMIIVAECTTNKRKIEELKNIASYKGSFKTDVDKILAFLPH